MAEIGTFAVTLRALRTERGWTQQELAERAGVSQNGLSQWELGKRDPTWPAVQAICRALEVSCERFMEPLASVPKTRKKKS